ncbi:MAG: ABC transporter substrate-binding protein [Desulfobulbaceae bacterium]|jgi:branched-chain amino acid transport system substrate-binding protein|nr:ABC transporter substrate-binding protein [Desulfobulbaceae bacterium]
MKKLTLILLTLACGLAVFIACSQEPEPIKIGLAANLSGPGGSASEHIRDGALQAVEDINNQGGVKGRPLQLLVRDDQNSREGVLRADESLINAGVVAIIGHSQFANTLIAYPYVTSRNTILFTAYTSTIELSGRDDLFLRTAVDTALYGRKTASLLQSRGIRSVVCLIDSSNAVFGDSWLEETRRHFQGDISAVRFDPAAMPDWTQIMGELLNPGPDAVILLTRSVTTAKAAQFIRKQNKTIPLITSPWSQSPELINVGGQAVEGMTIITFINPENSLPAYLSFSERMERNFGKKATARSARAHELITILADGLTRSTAMGGEPLKTAILAVEYDSILGRVGFDRFGDVVRPVYEVQVRDGELKTVGEIR